MKIYTGETREMLDESILITATVKIPRDMRRLNVTKGNVKKTFSVKTSPNLSLRKNLNSASLVAPVCRRGRGCCAATSMWKVELELEFNFLSGSGFLSRLVRQVISVPFVV